MKKTKEDLHNSFSIENICDFDIIKVYQKVKWTCEFGHTWEATLGDRMYSSV